MSATDTTEDTFEIIPSSQYGTKGYAYKVGPKGAPHTTGWARSFELAVKLAKIAAGVAE